MEKLKCKRDNVRTELEWKLSGGERKSVDIA